VLGGVVVAEDPSSEGAADDGGVAGDVVSVDDAEPSTPPDGAAGTTTIGPRD
jgi:hypothetical protein